MAQLRQEYDTFVKKDTEVIAVGPEANAEFAEFWHSHDMPFPGLADHTHKVEDMYSQRVAFLIGRMPSVYIIDREGKIRYVHHGEDMKDIISNAEVLGLIDQLNEEAKVKT